MMIWVCDSALEAHATEVFGPDWFNLLEEKFTAHLVKYRKYKNTVCDLLRVIRNKKHHYRDLPADVQQILGPLPDGYLQYFVDRYPRLLLCCYRVVRKHCFTEYSFRTYFQPSL
jgi:hypothetical protein